MYKTEAGATGRFVMECFAGGSNWHVIKRYHEFHQMRGKNDEFCIQNEDLCIKNGEFCRGAAAPCADRGCDFLF